MLPENLVEGEGYVITPGVEKDGEDHPQLDPGDLVTLVNATPDSDGEVYVTATAMNDGATIGAWVKTEYLMPHECDCHDEDHGEEESYSDSDSWESFTPHPQFPNLPAYETLPLGYALGFVQYLNTGGVQPDPQQEFIRQYLQARGFPTA